jgi:hypothetical protein
MRRLLFASIVLVGFSLAANPVRTSFQRVVSFSQDKSAIVLRMDDGTSLNVMPAQLAIPRNTTVAQLSTISSAGSLQAAVRVSYRSDGSIDRVRVHVFHSDAETRAFLQKAANRRSNR